MTNVNSSSQPAPSKPPKPYPEFPLFPHASGRWAKKIRGRFVYFGKWDDHEAALQRYLDQKDALHAGVTPADTTERLTVFFLCGRFLTTKKNLLETGELSARSFDDYTATCKRLIKSFGKLRAVADLRPGDFEKLRAKMASGWGPVRLGNEMNRVRIVFNYAFKSGLIARPMLFGEGFRRPSKKTLRTHRQAQGPKMFTPDEVKRMLVEAGQPLRTMILLGLNAGYGNSDLGTLPLTALDLKSGWLSYSRPKTGISRRCPLWPETIRALKDWIAVRPTPKNPEHAGLLFVTAAGGSWAKATRDNPITKETRKLLDKLGINGHRNFYCLRHTFRTIADAGKDQPAADYIMGHAPESDDMASVYRELIEDDRLRAVTDHVRAWLWSAKKSRIRGSGKAGA